MSFLRPTTKPKIGDIINVEGNIDSLSDALKITTEVNKDRGTFVAFRGQGNSAWGLNPKVYRRARWFRHERDMVRELISNQPQEFLDDKSMLDKLVRMAHYGLPTRLLDITENMLVALYFSCKDEPDTRNFDSSIFVISGEKAKCQKYYDSDTISIFSNLSNLSEKEKSEISNNSINYMLEDGSEEEIKSKFNAEPVTKKLVQYIKSEKPYFDNNVNYNDLTEGPLYVVPNKNNRRIIAQNGAFLIFGVDFDKKNPPLRKLSVLRYNIPKDKKPEIIKELDILGITESSLFPEMDRMAYYISEKYKE